MKAYRLRAILVTCLLAVFALAAQASDKNAWGSGFTKKSLEGTYYITCACEGNVAGGGSIHSAGMGKIEFRLDGGVTITQFNLYTEIGNVINRYVKDGEPLAEFSGKYDVDPEEGYGRLYDGDFYPDLNEPSFMITKVRGKKATEIYLILPQDFITPFGPEPKHLIHVTAARRE